MIQTIVQNAWLIIAICVVIYMYLANKYNSRKTKWELFCLLYLIFFVGDLVYKYKMGVSIFSTINF